MNKYLIILLAVVIGVIPAGGALAFYGDTEGSVNNSLGATTLDFTLRDTGGLVADTLFNEPGVAPAPDWFIELLKVKKEPGLDFDYDARFVLTGGDATLCNELQLKVRHEGILVYTGPLSAFTYDAGVITGGQDDWSFEILFTNEDSSFENLSCQFDFVFNGEQIGGAGYYDDERVSNTFATGQWGAELGDVVINEIMWMGSNDVGSADEWIELKNTTGNPIDLAGWTIDGAGTGSSAITIASGIIPAGGYFLVGHYESTSSAVSDSITIDSVIPGISLNNDGEALTLQDSYNNVIDATPTGNWEEGNNNDTPADQRNSMERNDVPGEGTSWGDWHTCLDTGCRTTTFWDSEGDDYGTPKAANLSDNDPTSVAASTEEDTPPTTIDEPPAITKETENDATGTDGTENPEGDDNTEEKPKEPAESTDDPGNTDSETDPPAINEDEEVIIKEENSGEEDSNDGSEQQSGGSEEPDNDNEESNNDSGEESGGDEEPTPPTEEEGSEL